MSVTSLTPAAVKGNDLVSCSERLAEAVVAQQWSEQPELAARYGGQGRDKCLQDARYHILYLAESIAGGSPELFFNYLAWVKGLLHGLNVPLEDLRSQLVVLSEVLRQNRDVTDAQTAAEYLRGGLERLEAMPVEPLQSDSVHVGDTCAGLVQDILAALVACRRAEAVRLVDDAVAAGVSLDTLYLNVFQPLLVEVGRLWQLNRLSVAQEHYCTAAIQLFMGRLSTRVFESPRNGLSMVSACVGDELHEIGLRMVADLFELSGWNSYFLGANVPTRDIVLLLREHQANVLCLSATITTHLPLVRNVIQRVRSDPGLDGVKILVGGYPFNVQTTLWQRVGADGHAQDARSAVGVAGQLVGH